MSVNSTGTERDLCKLLLSRSTPEKEKAWEMVYQMYYPMIRDFVEVNSGGDTDATDIFQDGLMVLYRNLSNGTFRAEASIKTYLFSICRNLWLKELDKRQKERVLMEEVIAITDQDINYLIHSELVTLLMNELKPGCRDILTEYYFNKRPMSELMNMFNVSSTQAAKNKKMRCLSYLIKLVNERGVSTTKSR